ncbi:prephenate dehydratase [Rhodococcus sp. 27YEA15]|uniref:prephenate dehydratase n=1 Tax=Rhodococcus sp. 27YEA15 TaxID=3156259 RepID=UPI003C7DBFEF
MPTIAYFGPSGTFTEIALAQLEASGAFDGPVERVSAGSPPATLDLVRDGLVDGAVVPFENSVEGGVAPTLDSLALGSPLQIIAETDLDVSFSILVRPGTTADQVRSIGAYPHAAAQVRQWIADNLPGAQTQLASSNAAAALDVQAGTVDAGVSTALAGELLGLSSLADEVADVGGARTRFVLVTKPAPVPAKTGADRTALVLQLDNEPGSLVRALSEFAERGIDLTRIESRPMRTELGTYRFFVDCIGHVDDSLVAEAMRALHRKSGVRFLGSWPTANSVGPQPPSDDEAIQWIEQIKRGEGAR